MDSTVKTSGSEVPRGFSRSMQSIASRAAVMDHRSIMGAATTSASTG
ncbi:hypothetical protein ACFOLD_04860 [Kocuria carniphila]